MMELLAVQNVMLVETSDAGIVTGNPEVFQGYPYLYLPKTHTHAGGMGICG
jgi:hypothetical protein